MADPEVTWWGQQIFRVFSSVALGTVVKILDPIIWETTLAFVDFSPRILVCTLALFLLSVLIIRGPLADRYIVPHIRNIRIVNVS